MLRVMAPTPVQTGPGGSMQGHDTSNVSIKHEAKHFSALS